VKPSSPKTCRSFAGQANVRGSPLERWAHERGIRYQYGARGGIWTTTTAINEALGIKSTPSNSDNYSPDLI